MVKKKITIKEVNENHVCQYLFALLDSFDYLFR